MNEIIKNDIDAAHHKITNLLIGYIENVGNYYIKYVY